MFFVKIELFSQLLPNSAIRRFVSQDSEEAGGAGDATGVLYAVKRGEFTFACDIIGLEVHTCILPPSGVLPSTVRLKTFCSLHS